LNFLNQFLPDNPKTDPHILDKLMTDENLSGFLNWALEGLQRLLKNGKFSYSKTTEETWDLYTKFSDTTMFFVEKCIDINPRMGVSKPRLYEVYKKWCIDKMRISISKQAFNRKLVQYIPEIQTMRPRVDGRMLTYWLGVELNGRAKCAQKQLNLLLLKTTITNEKADIARARERALFRARRAHNGESDGGNWLDARTIQGILFAAFLDH